MRQDAQLIVEFGMDSAFNEELNWLEHVTPFGSGRWADAT
jgi:hypothetical protein